MPRTFVHANEATAAQRRVYFDLRDATDGLTAETGEGSGQPQISTNGGSWTNTGIGTLTHIGNGRYYADLTQSAVATAGDLIETRYKSANTAETPGDSIQVVAFDPADAVRLGLTALPNAAADAAGGLPISDTGGLDLDTQLGRLDAAISSRLSTVGYTPPDNSSIASILQDTDADLPAYIATRTLAAADYVSGLRRGTAQAGASEAITLDSGASAVNDYYNGRVVTIVSGTGAGQARYIWDYVGATREATTLPAWVTVPDATSVFQILPWAGVTGIEGQELATSNQYSSLNTSLNTISGYLDTEVAAILAAVDTEVAAIKAKTDNLPSDPADESSIQGTLATIVAAISALNNLSAAQVNAEVVDVIRTDTLSELGVGAPAATPTVATAIMLLYMALRNAGQQTATEFRITNDAGTVICEAEVSDDGTTFTRSELGAPD